MSFTGQLKMKNAKLKMKKRAPLKAIEFPCETPHPDPLPAPSSQGEGDEDQGQYQDAPGRFLILHF
jgi:hypothetical protein